MSDDKNDRTNHLSSAHSDTDVKHCDTVKFTAETTFNENIISPMRKAAGVGDTPDLISEETPPLAVLDITSDSELVFFQPNTSNNSPTGGQRTETNVNPFEESFPASSSTEKPISDETKTSSQKVVNVAVPMITETGARGYPAADSSILMFPPTSQPATSTILNDSISRCSPISSSHQTQMITSDDNQNGEKFAQIVQQEQGNDAQKESLTFSLENMAVHTKSIDRAYMQESLEQITEPVIKSEDYMPSTTTTKRHGNGAHDAMKSGAVTTPEVERDVELDSSIVEKSVSTDNITKSINMDKSYDDVELLSQQQLMQLKHRPSDSPISESEDHTACEVPLEATGPNTKCKISPRSSSSCGRKDLLSALAKSRKVEQEKIRPMIKRKQSCTSTRNSGKSPIRVLEVYDRNTSMTPLKMQMKPSKSGKPMSPYQCKIFPILQEPDPSQKSSFRVNPRQCQILDKELSRGLESEKLSLVKALSAYFKNDHQTNTGSPSSCASGKVDNLIISDGSKRETFMSWMIEEKYRERSEEGENSKSDAYWNPMGNILRKSTFTQVSSRPSFTTTAKEDARSDEQGINNSTPQLTNPISNIRQVGNQRSTDIFHAGWTMYQSLKSVQKAIHLSDLLCFQNNIPDLPLGETVSQPGFQQFMESENEIEILENITSLMDMAKDEIVMYLDSLQKANLIPENDSKPSKMQIPHNNNNSNELNRSKDENESREKDDPNVESTQESQQIVPFTCPSCHSQMDLEISNLEQIDGICNNTIVPQVCTFLGERGKIILNTYYTNESKSLVQTALCDGHMYQTHFACSGPAGPLHGITKAKKEYLGQPSHTTLEILLSTIHRCASYIDTRIACSCVWSRQSKNYLFEVIESYLEKQYVPTTKMSRWTLYNMEKKLKKINVFAGIIRSFSEELVEAVNKIHFCMQKGTILLSTNLKEFETSENDLETTNSSWNDIKSGFSPPSIHVIPTYSFHEYCEINMISSTERLYEKLKAATRDEQIAADADSDSVSVQILVQIIALAERDIDSASGLAGKYAKVIQMPGKKARRVLKFLSITMSQIGFCKDVQFGPLVTTFLSVLDKLSLIEEFMCEQKMEIRLRIRKMCVRIIRKLYDLRGNLCMQMNWSNNLAKKSLMRIKEINEIRRIKQLKKVDRHMNTDIEFLGGSDTSLRTAIC